MFPGVATILMEFWQHNMKAMIIDVYVNRIFTYKYLQITFKIFGYEQGKGHIAGNDICADDV